MKTNFSRQILIATLSLTGIAMTQAPALAYTDPIAAAIKVVELKDGSSVYIFQDGKMAMESITGRVTHMNPGDTMEARDGSKIVMQGNEVARLYSLKEYSR